MAYQKILVRMLPLLLIVPGLALAGSDVGKVRQKVGSVARLKVNKDVWDSLKVAHSASNGLLSYMMVCMYNHHMIK